MKTTKSRWKIVLKTIYELAPYKDMKTAGMTPEDVLSHMQLDFPDITRQGVFSAISTAITRHGAPIGSRPDPKKTRGVLYYVPLGARKKAHGILASVPVSRPGIPRREEPVGHPPGANNPPAKSTDLVQGANGKFYAPDLEQSFREQKKPRFPAPKTAATIRLKNCLYLIWARAPRSLCTQDVADFFFISMEEATETLTATCKKYSDIVEVTVHAKLK